jgi:glycosyltransferase involved in cell wall biosynthesis
MFENKILMITGGNRPFGNAALHKFLNTDFSEIRIFSRDLLKQGNARIALKNFKFSSISEMFEIASRIEKIKKFINERPIKRKIGIGSNPVFIFVGGLTRRNGIVALVDTFSEVRRQGNNFCLLVLGDGPERKKLEHRIHTHGLEDNVSLLGQVSEPFDCLSKANCFILPSHSEGTSRVAMEALYAGVPCIMRDVDSNADLISTSKQGELFSSHGELIDKTSEFCREYRPQAKEYLLCKFFSQEFGSQRYLNLICSLDDR